MTYNDRPREELYLEFGLKKNVTLLLLFLGVLLLCFCLLTLYEKSMIGMMSGLGVLFSVLLN